MTDDLFLATLDSLPDHRGSAGDVLLAARALDKVVAPALSLHDVVAAAQRLRAAGKIKIAFDRHKNADVITKKE